VGCSKASELARPPMRTTANAHANSHASTSTPPDCFIIYDLFVSSVIALISFHLVSECSVIALNYRTFVSFPLTQQDAQPAHSTSSSAWHWLTSIHVHWTSSGTLLVSTYTQESHAIRSLSHVPETEHSQLIGKCVRVAPNGTLAKIASFDDPIQAIVEGPGNRPRRKRARLGTLEQSVAKWKSAVRRWLAWKGYSLPDLDQGTSWVRISTAQASQHGSYTPSAEPEREILWPRALCFHYDADQSSPTQEALSGQNLEPSDRVLRWFAPPDAAGYKDPLDIAQEWYLGKLEREKALDAQRKAKKAEEESARRKDENTGMLPSSPLNARIGTYGDVQLASGVYPTPPDGVMPGTILAPGGSNPAINVSAPQEDASMDGHQHPLTSPAQLSAPENFNVSNTNDDLFEDMEEDTYEGDGVEDADFDFFDAHDEDVNMMDAPAPSLAKPGHLKGPTGAVEPPVVAEPPPKEDVSDPLSALENALASASEPSPADVHKIKEEPSLDEPVHQQADIAPTLHPQTDKTPTLRVDTPPLSPTLIQRTLTTPLKIEQVPDTLQDQAESRHRNSVFEPLAFSRKMSMTDAKYQGGRYSVSQEKESKDLPEASHTPPTRMKSLRDLPLLTNMRYAIGVASAKSKLPEITCLARAVDDDSDIEEDSSEASDEDSDGPDLPLPASFSAVSVSSKRKLPTDGNATPVSVTSFAESLGGDPFDFHHLHLDETSLIVLEPNSWDWSLVTFPAPTQRSVTGARYSMPSFSQPPTSMPDTPTSQTEFAPEIQDERPLDGNESIAVIQIITEQTVYTTLDLLQEDPPSAAGTVACTSSEIRWHAAIRSLFPKAVGCDLPALAAVHDVFPDFSAQAKGQQRLPPRKPSEGTAVPGNQMYPINPPFLRVRRAETHWDLLPPAIPFWETLGLSPVNSVKNIVTFCVYPGRESLRSSVESFMMNLQIAYESCKLGSHTRIAAVGEFVDGLVPCEATSNVPPRSAFKETCVRLGKTLAIRHAQAREQEDVKVDAFVIYMVDPFGTSSALWELCSAFWALFQAYGQSPSGRPDQTQKPDLVLQLVPIKYIASVDVPVILETSIYINLAREVYNRCPPSIPSADKTPLSTFSAPAFQLEECLPRNVPFKLISEPPQDLLRENSYMHLSYAISFDGTWITAAWTDNCGKSQAVVSYHLGTRGFGEVAKEIWSTTIEILQSRKVHWRVCIAKAGVMDREELETWVLLVSCPTQFNLFITLLTVDTEPPLKLMPAVPGNPATGQPPANTPGSTPQAGVSPDPAHGLTPAATPSADNSSDPTADPDARLVDVTDETWGIILAHRLQNSNSTNQFSPALISGLLVKRGETPSTTTATTPHLSLGPIVVAVNILWIGAINSTRAATSPFPPGNDGMSPGGANIPPSPSPQERSTSSLMWTPTVQTRTTAENLLKEVLGQFRALGLLARLKGMRGTRHGSVPWHVAAAQRGVKGLGKVVGGL
jgi:mediator of RNA polymerase II transcription subunit 13